MAHDTIDVSRGILVFSSDYCPYCVRAKQLLAAKKVEFTEFRVDGDPELRQIMTQMAGRTSVPQIWLHGQHIGGCDDLYALEQQGRLDALLAGPR